jgi:hypothetical protein
MPFQVESRSNLPQARPPLGMQGPHPFDDDLLLRDWLQVAGGGEKEPEGGLISSTSTDNASDTEVRPVPILDAGFQPRG